MKQVMRVLALAIGCGILAVAPAAAAGYSETSSFDPTPGQPKSGDECTITFSSGGDSAQNKSDVAKAKQAFDTAMQGSDDMQNKVKDACAKHGNSLTVNIKRDDKDENIASTPCDGSLDLDLGDIESVGSSLAGKPQDKAKLVAGLLTEVLAHEVDHNRQSPTEDHGDPASDHGATGKPVDDENAVMKDLNTGVQRNQYGYTGADGKSKIDFTVDKQKVTFDLTGFLAARTGVSKFAPAQEYAVDPALILELPEVPCSQGAIPCYRDLQDGSPPFYLGDGDLDGVDDFSLLGPLDNCPGLANPQQADTDADLLGQGCDGDDDADGFSGGFECAAGASDMNGTSLPEHWIYPGTCTDGLDNDRDRIIDNADQSCHAPPPNPLVFPSPTPVRDVFPLNLRRDRGSIPEGVDVLPVHLSLNVFVFASGMEVWQLSGPMAIVRSEPADRDMDGLREIATEIASLELTGFSPSLGPLRLGVQGARPSRGQAEDIDLPDPIDYPAESFFDIFFTVQLLPFEEWTNELPDPYRGTVDQWPFYGALHSRPPTPPTVLFDSAHTPRAEIMDGLLEARIPDSDFEGLPDYADICPFQPDPGQPDADADRIGDLCDLCPLDFDPDQEDMDLDGLGDVCDPDLDGDDVPNLLDCAPANPLAAQWPPEVIGVMVTRGGPEITVTWQAPLHPRFRDAFDVLSGDVGVLRHSGGYDPSLLECLEGNALSHYTLDERAGPYPGEAAFYLVRQRNACGVGTYGDSGQVPDPRDELDFPGGVPCPR